MPHRNAHGHLVPDHLWEVAERVHRLVQRDGVLDRWRGQIAEWLERQVVSPTLDEHGYLRLSERPAGEYSPLDFELRMDEKYAVLGAIHDLAASSGTVLIGPHDRPDEVTAGACAYLVLRVTVAEYSQTEAAYLLRFLADFQADLGDLVGHNDAEVEALADVEAMAQHGTLVNTCWLSCFETSSPGSMKKDSMNRPCLRDSSSLPPPLRKLTA